MAGHSHWANNKHKKALIDAKRGKLWSRLSKAIIVAARSGSDPTMNARLRLAIDAAKAVSMPKDNIERAIKKGSGELSDGAVMEEILYEGYGAGGSAVLCEILTDNRNRTAPEIRKIFEVGGGKMGATNCVAWMFDRKGLFVVDATGVDEDKLMEVALEANADDVSLEDEIYEVTCLPEAFTDVAEALQSGGFNILESSISRIPQNMVDVTDEDDARKVLKMVDLLEDHDDVSAVYSNFEISDQLREKIEG
ncbi:MAG: YebC/PmpR family DNA-binding transcriptional regulator [Planctomycetia bacterium]|nr:YebC/PmpR family DNA-binding transcriptional regulator [Planctomycetia bacterium]